MQHNLDTLSAIVLGVVTTTIAGPYMGAIVIAFVASFTRTAFENICGEHHWQCFLRWIRYFLMATGVAMFCVSVSGAFEWNNHVSVMFGGFFACFAHETIEFCKNKVDFVLNKLLKKAKI